MITAWQNTKKLIQNQKPSMEFNGNNLSQWQKDAKSKLCELIGYGKFTKVAPETEVEYTQKIEGATEIRFTFASEDGYRVPCHLLLPDGVANPPVMICLQGHCTGMHISLARPKYPGDENDIKDGDRDFCIRAVKEGWAAVALEQRNFGECGETKGDPRCYESAVTALLMGRTTIGERVWDVARLIDVLESDFSDKVDVNTIGCMGNSGGGTATAYIAALEDRVKIAVPSCAMCTYKDSIGAMYHCSCNYVPHIAEYFDMGDLMAMAYPKFFIQVSGKEDNIFPIDAAKEVFSHGKSAYESMGDADKCAMVEGNGGHRFYAEPAWKLIHGFIK